MIHGVAAGKWHCYARTHWLHARLLYFFLTQNTVGKTPTASFSYMVPKKWHGYIQMEGKIKKREKIKKQESKKLQSIYPCLHAFFQARFNSVSNLMYSSFEKIVTFLDTFLFILKDDLVPVIPYTPTSSHHCNFEEGIIRSGRILQDHINKLKICVPFFTYFPPYYFTYWATQRMRQNFEVSSSTSKAYSIFEQLF
jgi:hypothetical protein